MLRACGVERVLELEVRIHGVVLRAEALLADRIVERCRHLGLVGEELSELDVGGDGILRRVVGGAFHDALFESAISLGGHLAHHVERGDVGELHVERALCGPSSLVVVFKQTELVDPHLAALDIGRKIPDTDDHGLHLAERGVTHDGYLVVGLVVGVGGVRHVVGSHPFRPCLVALLLELGEDGERNVEHVLLGPYGAAVLRRIAVVGSLGGELQGQLVLVIVVLIVGAEPDEDGELVVGEVGDVLRHGVGMGEHLYALILPEVEVGVLVDGLGRARAEVGDGHGERLLVALDELGLCGVLLTTDARRQDVVDGLLVVVLLDTDGADGHLSRLGTAGERLFVDAPFAAHEVERTEAQHDGLFEVGAEHAHEAYAGEAADRAHLPLEVLDGDAELIPGRLLRVVVVAQVGVCDALVDDVVLPDDEVFGTDADVVLVILLVLVECVVLVDVLDIGCRLIGRAVALGRVLVVGRVALRHVDAFVATEDGSLHLVEVGAAEVVVVVVGGVVHDAVEGCRTDLSLNLGEELLVGFVRTLLVVVEAVVAHILQVARAGSGSEGVGHRTLRGNLTPLRIVEALRPVDGHSALVELFAVAEDVLAHLAEVDVEVAAIPVGVGLVLAVEEGVEEPELDILDVGGLEVAGVELAHHAAPSCRGVGQRGVGVEVGVEVVRSSLGGIVGQVEDLERCRLSGVVALVAEGEELAYGHLADVEVGKLVEVALDMAGRERRRATGEERVDVVPCQQGSVVTAGDPRLVGMLGEHARDAGDDPRRGSRHIERVLCILEVVEIGSVVLRSVGLSGDEVCKLAGEGDLRGSRAMQTGQFVEHVGEPLALLLPVHVDAPERVVERFVAHRHLRGKRLFGEMLQRTAELEVLGEVVAPVDTHHRLSLLGVVGGTL